MLLTYLLNYAIFISTTKQKAVAPTKNEPPPIKKERLKVVNMVNTDKVIGFYTDVFGNEVDEYEQIERYTVWYEGYLFDGDTDGYNEHGYDKFEDAITLYDAYGDMIHIKDNEYGVSFDYGEWS